MTDKELAEEYRKQFKQRLIDEDDFERLENFDENVEENNISFSSIEGVPCGACANKGIDRGLTKWYGASWYLSG